MSLTRADFKHLKRILIKVGTSVIIHQDGSVALGRLGNLTEQITYFLKAGKEVVLVTSGAVGMGSTKLQQQALLSTPLRNHIQGGTGLAKADNRACAAAGQSSLMALYEFLFAQKGIQCSQVLVTDEDFQAPERRENLKSTLNILLSLGVLPILNENDVISTRKVPIRDPSGKVLWDNDSLAMLVSMELGVELMILLSDVEGLYKNPPSANNPRPEIIHTYTPSLKLSFNVGEKSRTGRGGMQAKIDAALHALNHDVKAVVIASGYRADVVRDLIEGKVIGTIFVQNPGKEEKLDTHGSVDGAHYQHVAQRARAASRALQSQLTSDERSKVVHAIADALTKNIADILEANKKDLDAAKLTNLSASLLARLQLTEVKIRTLAEGIKQIADTPEPVGRVLGRTQLSDGLILQKETVPIGVLLVIFESRPDALPQIAALAVRSGNALLLKGGKEATFSNQILHKLIVGAISEASNGRVAGDLVTLIETRQAIDDLLKLDTSVIDLVIPRGSSELVKHIQSNTKIPVLGHAEGICHVFVDKSADIENKAIPIVIDSKTDYPAACNAAETILLHSDLPRAAVEKIVKALKTAGVQLFGGPKAAQVLALRSATTFKHEYSEKAVTLEFVDSVGDAIAHINQYSSSHTDSIVTEDAAAAQRFLNEVDSACVFHNASTRFSDGYRFGLGAEVGISTSRIHARGPVGIEGLMTTKWKLQALNGTAQIVSQYSKGEKKFTHQVLPVVNSKL